MLFHILITVQKSTKLTTLLSSYKGFDLDMWNTDLAITEADAILAAKSGALQSMRIVKNGDEFHVFVRFTWRKEELFLSTTRTQKEPRKFKHVGRLIEYIENHYPNLASVEVVLKPTLATVKRRAEDTRGVAPSPTNDRV